MSSNKPGVLNIDKPGGLTSHDVVARVRRLTGIRRVGHAGTLDPMATGVLLVCVGAATRIASYLQQGKKVYETVVRLGEETDTYDAEGQCIAETMVPDFPLEVIDRNLDAFRGDILQTPPMYSAIKKNGQPLYKLARAGKVIERPKRPITIDVIQVLDWKNPDLTLRITCSPGTYIRSIAHDLGQMLGVGGHVHSLRRVASGSWRVEDAVTLAALEAAGKDWPRYLHGLRAALAMLPVVVLSMDQAYRFALGQRIAFPEAPVIEGALRVLGPSETFIGIGKLRDGILSPHKIFADPTKFKIKI
ncbi:MAG: tRNA pseudouridine(55) synthase TruB [Clostridia bacterium]|nr:MAG: tRNA pseudouridine(55) synthase TruB [Clostridia bacterium]